MDDSQVIAKLHFFSYVPSTVEPFLKQFQADKLMIPLLFFELKTITRLFEIIMQSKSLNPANLPDNLTKRNYYLLIKLTIASVNFVVNREAILCICNHIFLDKGVHKRCSGVCHRDIVKII